VRRDTFTEGTGASDAVSALIEFGDGRSATVVSSIGAPQIGAKVDVVGARGNVSHGKGRELSGCTFAPCDIGGETEPLDLRAQGGANPDVALQAAFAAAIREGRPSQAASLRDGLSSLLVTLAALRSSDEGRRVALAEL
jgi:predicted dehydrogenase